MTTSRRNLLKGGAGLLVLSSLPCVACRDDGVPDLEEADLELVDGFLDVPLELYPELDEVGGFVLVLFRGFIMVISRVETETFVCLDALCTHSRCAVRYNPATRQFPCPCHGSIFAESGAVIQGPAEASLPSFPTEFAGESVIVDLREAPIQL